MQRVGAYLRDHQVAIASDPSHSIHFDYLTAKVVFTQLTEHTQVGSKKSFFGTYTSPLTEEWHQLVQRYETGLHWAEQARDLQNSAIFGLPSLKVEVNRLQHSFADAQQKLELFQVSMRDHSKRFSKACDELKLKPLPDYISSQLLE